MELHNKFKKSATSPINNETINSIEKLNQDTTQPQRNKRESLENDSRISLSDLENRERISTASASASSSKKTDKKKLKENVFKKLKTKIKEKLDFWIYWGDFLVL